MREIPVGGRLPNRTLIRLAAATALFMSLSAGPYLFAQEHTAPASVPDLVPNAANTGFTIARTQEDFSSLSLDGSDLHSMEPISGGHQETPEFVRDLYQEGWRANDPIDLYVIRPAKVKNPPVVLYLYGFPSDTARFRDDAYCQRLVRNGAAAVGFVSALTGPRYSHRPMNQWFVSELQESLAMSVHDVQMILNYLETRGDVDMSRVGMFGQGSGGAIAILAAAADPRIKALDLLQPWGDWPDWLAESLIIPHDERPNYLKPEFLKKLEPLEPMRYLPGLQARSVRIQFVEQVPPMKSAKRIEEAVPSAAKIIHYESSQDLYSSSAGGRLFQWIADQLKPAVEIKASSQATQPPETAAKRGESH
jgi:pimeloyl-ACP methyl ester carboxylesterase